MANSRRSAATPKRRSRYTPPEQSQIREVVIGDLLPHLQSAQRSLTFDADAVNARAVWCAGSLALLTRGPRVAIVGTRNVSSDGAKRARKLAKELIEKNIVVVSGLAKGVDTEALTAAMNAHGSVIAVIGTPLDEAYPIENAQLQETIAREHLLISQFRQGTRTFRGHFPERNRLMAAISDVTVVIEAGDTSGTLHQVVECVRLKRWVFIAKNVMEDPSLKWPANFKDYPNVRTLSATSDILSVLNI